MAAGDGRLPLLVVEDAPDAQYFYEKVLRPSAYQVYPAYTLHEAELALERIEPAAIILDVVLGTERTWELLVRLRHERKTARTPIIVVSAVAERDRALALGADAYLEKPVDRRRLIETLTTLQARTVQALRVLVIDDEEVARYLVRQCLPVPSFDVIEADGAESGFASAREERPDVILLDLAMADGDGRDVLRRLKQDAATRDIRVLVVTSQVLDDGERAELLRHADGVMSKAAVTRATLCDAVRAAIARTTPDVDEKQAPRPI